MLERLPKDQIPIPPKDFEENGDECIYCKDCEDNIDINLEEDKINDEYEEYNKKAGEIHNLVGSGVLKLENLTKDNFDNVNLIDDSELKILTIPTILQTYFEKNIPSNTFLNITMSAVLEYVSVNREKITILNVYNGIFIKNSFDSKHELLRRKGILDDIAFFPYSETCHIKNDEEHIYVRNLKIGAFKMVSNLDNILVFINNLGRLEIYSENVLEKEEIDWLVSEFLPYIEKKKEEKVENMNYIFADPNGNLYCSQFNIEKADIDISLQYNDDFKEVSDGIVDRLNNQDKGLVILSGIKGSGKTYYLRWLTKNVNKRFIYVPRYFYSTLSSTTFFNFLINHCKNSIAIFEDAEEVVKRRDSHDGNYLISDILEMSDGLTNDILKIQMIFTFNTDIKNIDDALLRPSRLLARYDFGKLGVEKSNKLLAHLGKNAVVDEPKTLAELYNIDNMPIEVMNEKVKKFGF